MCGFEALCGRRHKNTKSASRSNMRRGRLYDQPSNLVNVSVTRPQAMRQTMRQQRATPAVPHNTPVPSYHRPAAVPHNTPAPSRYCHPSAPTETIDEIRHTREHPQYYQGKSIQPYLPVAQRFANSNEAVNHYLSTLSAPSASSSRSGRSARSSNTAHHGPRYHASSGSAPSTRSQHTDRASWDRSNESYHLPGDRTPRGHPDRVINGSTARNYRAVENYIDYRRHRGARFGRQEFSTYSDGHSSMPAGEGFSQTWAPSH